MDPHSVLRREEEGWREGFDRLRERFPTVTPEKVAQALRNHDGHGGSAAAELREMTSTVVKPPDPEDAEHVATLLSSPAMFKHACSEQFKKFDCNGDGVLQWEEVLSLVNDLYYTFGLQQPSEGCLKAFFEATDENGDGVLNEREFRKFFEMFLRYAFFDFVKMRQIVERGKAKMALVGNEAQDLQRPEDEPGLPTEAHTSQPQPHATAEMSTSSVGSRSEPRELKREASGQQREPTDQRESRESQGETRTSSAAVSGGDRDGREPRDHRERGHGESRHARQSKREENEPSRKNDSSQAENSASNSSLGMTLICTNQNGISYRNCPDFDDRKSSFVQYGETVQVLEHWVRTPNGWLPVYDMSGNLLLERQRRSKNTERGETRHRGSERNESAPTPNRKRATESRRAESEIAEHRPPARQEVCGKASSGSAPADLPEEWKSVFERLCQRFPHASVGQVVQALKDNDGHAGQAAGALRGG